MKKRKPVNGFKKGVSGNPNGRPAVPEDVREIRKFESNEFIRIMSKFLSMNMEQFKAASTSGKLNMRELRIAKMIQEELRGQIRYVVEMNDRLMGKPDQSVTVLGDQSAPLSVLISKDLDGF